MIITIYLSVVAISLVIFKIYQVVTCGVCKCDAKIINKVVIVTGGNSGIGYETAKNLAERGAKIILACRNEDKGIAARDEIISATGNHNIIYKHLDLASFKSVRLFADDILKTEKRLDILINNAGTGKLDNSLTEDNLPIEAQGNHFGPFLLTMLLLPLLKTSTPSRIINVSSIMHKFGKLDPDKFVVKAKTSMQHRRVYSNTKLANMLFTRKLSKMLEGTGVTVNALHPGGVNTEIFRNQMSAVRFLLRLFLKTPVEGAQTSIYLAVDPTLSETSGRYFADCRETKPAKKALDDATAEALWELSENIVGMRY